MSSAVPPLDQVATYQLSIKAVFERLSQNEKLYAHHLSQAAWHGSRIIMRQASPEGTGIFDFILELHKAWDSQWNQFVQDFGVSIEELETFLEFAGMFLARLNNFCVCVLPTFGLNHDINISKYDKGEGDRKIVPNMTKNALRKMARISSAAAASLEKVIDAMLSINPSTMGAVTANVLSW